MGYLAALVVVIVVSTVTNYYTNKKQNKLTMIEIKEQYGKKPNRVFNREEIVKYLNCTSVKRDVDEITWNDLDMNNIFKRINNCNSFIGEQVLYKKLHSIVNSDEEMNNYEKMINHFNEDQEKRIEIQMILEKLGRRKSSYYLPQFVNEIGLIKIRYIFLYRLMSLGLFGMLLLGLFSNPIFMYVAGLFFIFNAGIYAIGKHKFEMHLEMLSTILEIVNVFNKLICSDRLIKEKLAQESILSAIRMGKAVNKIVLIQRKMNNASSGDFGAMIIDYLIGSTLWDFHVFHKIVNLLLDNKDEFNALYNLVGEIDSLISIASFRESLPHFCEPTFHRAKLVDIKDMFHPLVDQPVFNNVYMDSNFMITGSNASGKSTYIKAVAINMILAQSINTCLAEWANIPKANIMTSMAVRDDITTGESYYIKEINYLKRIITQINEDKLTLCIVDEILRGTNTEERVAASVAILKYLSDKNCITIVASHDIEISEMLKGCYENAHFSEQMSRDDIYFDYKVKAGISKSKNAIKLLSHIGFPQAIVNHAEAIVTQMGIR